MLLGATCLLFELNQISSFLHSTLSSATLRLVVSTWIRRCLQGISPLGWPQCSLWLKLPLFLSIFWRTERTARVRQIVHRLRSCRAFGMLARNPGRKRWWTHVSQPLLLIRRCRRVRPCLWPCPNSAISRIVSGCSDWSDCLHWWRQLRSATCRESCLDFWGQSTQACWKLC